ncbi:hypothetical protein L6164_013275 [Bauhinia variegata]|uniref:Uncharacterized protein n=1 Tax=Bauhinia variegata TaxID=167791 RepID=A0ACB9PCS0_BAUVA|nr:hypothetical protein L6164_013275 [Bauhinia variegata]
MAVSSLLFSSIPTGAPSSKVAPLSRAAPCRRIAPAARVASAGRAELAAASVALAPAGARTVDLAIDTNVARIPYTDDVILPLKRSDFPEGFAFGTSTSAYQIEGGTDSRGKSAWDYFTHTYPDKIVKGQSGDTACDSCRLYMDDIRLMKEMNADSYRFSISWSRILPTGKKSGGISQEGIDYYNDVIDGLLANNITPYVTLLHVDRPHSLEEEYKGFLSSKMIDDFKDLADICFEKFGDRVKHWMTLNEPRVYAAFGYSNGLMAPGRCSSWQQDYGCIAGDSGTEPYTVGHNLLLAHAAVVDLYRNNYQAKQDGKIGIAFDSTWFVPNTESEKDQKAAERALDFHLGWFLEPVKSGDYPASMRELVGSRLPKFDESEAKSLKGSYDFIGLNYYTSQFASDVPEVTTPVSYVTDHHCKLDYFRGDTPIGLASASGMYVYPKGLRDLLCYVKKNYNDPEIYITENGYAELDDPFAPVEEACMDINRIDYIYKHLYHLHSAITKDEVNVKGYFAWSLLDNFEWSSGYNLRFGLHYTDYMNLKRFPKYSARWLKQFLSQ